MIDIIFAVCLSLGAPKQMPERVWVNLCIAVAQVESNLNPDAERDSKDFGLFQINKKSHPKFFEAGNWRDPEYNARYGISHLKWLVENTDGGYYGYDIQTALAKYNTGIVTSRGLAYADHVLALANGRNLP